MAAVHSLDTDQIFHWRRVRGLERHDDEGRRWNEGVVERGEETGGGQEESRRDGRGARCVSGRQNKQQGVPFSSIGNRLERVLEAVAEPQVGKGCSLRAEGDAAIVRCRRHRSDGFDKRAYAVGECSKRIGRDMMLSGLARLTWSQDQAGGAPAQLLCPTLCVLRLTDVRREQPIICGRATYRGADGMCVWFFPPALGITLTRSWLKRRLDGA